jgi:hypothetical protein
MLFQERDCGANSVTDMARPPVQKPPIRPRDLLESRRGDLRSRQTNKVISQALRSRRQEHHLIVAVIVWLIFAAFCIGIGFVAWLIIGTITMYRF